MESIQSKRILVLTDFSTHHAFETLYPLARGLASQEEIATVHVGQADPSETFVLNGNLAMVEVDDGFSLHSARKQLKPLSIIQSNKYEGVLLWYAQKPNTQFLNSLTSAFNHSEIVGGNFPAVLLSPNISATPANRFFGVGNSIVGSMPVHLTTTSTDFTFQFSPKWSAPDAEETEIVQNWIESTSPAGPDFFTLETTRDPAGKTMIQHYYPNQLAQLYTADISSGSFMIREAAERLAKRFSVGKYDRRVSFETDTHQVRLNQPQRLAG